MCNGSLIQEWILKNQNLKVYTKNMTLVIISSKTSFLCTYEPYLPNIVFRNTPFDSEFINNEFLIAFSHWVLKPIFLDLHRAMADISLEKIVITKFVWT